MSYSNSNVSDQLSWTWNVRASVNNMYPLFLKKVSFISETVGCLWLILYFMLLINSALSVMKMKLLSRLMLHD